MLRRRKNINQTSHIPVVMMNSSHVILSNPSGVEKGIDAYLLIPLDELELQTVINNLVRLKFILQENYPCTTLSEIKVGTASIGDDCFMQKILSLIEANIDDDQFGIIELCYALGMSRAQIYRKFKSLTDRTPHDYMRYYRLQRAKELLHTTKLNVSEVAYRTGFKNVSHFSRIFTQQFGKSPCEFGR